MIADELRRQADQFIDLADLEPIIARDPSTRPARTTSERSALRQPREASEGATGFDEGDDPKEH
jgi:hypothetical protein